MVKQKIAELKFKGIFINITSIRVVVEHPLREVVCVGSSGNVSAYSAIAGRCPLVDPLPCSACVLFCSLVYPPQFSNPDTLLSFLYWVVALLCLSLLDLFVRLLSVLRCVLRINRIVTGFPCRQLGTWLMMRAFAVPVRWSTVERKLSLVGCVKVFTTSLVLGLREPRQRL